MTFHDETLHVHVRNSPYTINVLEDEKTLIFTPWTLYQIEIIHNRICINVIKTVFFSTYDFNFLSEKITIKVLVRIGSGFPTWNAILRMFKNFLQVHLLNMHIKYLLRTQNMENETLKNFLCSFHSACSTNCILHIYPELHLWFYGFNEPNFSLSYEHKIEKRYYLG